MNKKLRSRQDSNLRGLKPNGFLVHRLNHSATTMLRNIAYYSKRFNT